MFQDRMEVWEEIEAKVISDNDVPVVKTHNKVSDSFQSKFVVMILGIKLSQASVFQEITSILKELKRVQCQLEGESLSFTDNRKNPYVTGTWIIWGQQLILVFPFSSYQHSHGARWANSNIQTLSLRRLLLVWSSALQNLFLKGLANWPSCL